MKRVEVRHLGKVTEIG
jgi:hypothetical protein